MTTEEYWAVELEGHQFDLEEASQALALPSEPWIEKEKDGDGLLLRSASWSLLGEGEDVTDDAKRLLDRINGALLLNDLSAQPLKIAGVHKFDANGKRLPIIIAGSAQITLRPGRMRAVGQVTAADGSIVEPPPPVWRNWLDCAEQNETVADLLTHLNSLDDWYDLYKCVELIEDLSGGERGHLKAFQKDAGDWKRVKQMANCKRHAPSSKFPPPTPPPSLKEARTLVLKLAKLKLSDVC